MTGGALLLIALLSAPAQGESSDPALKRGLKHFSAGNWKAAIKGLSAAAPRIKDTRERAVVFKQIGLCQMELKRPSEAEQAFVLALTDDPLLDLNPAEDLPSAVVVFRAVRSRLSGTLVVTAAVDGASVFLDDVARGVTPFKGEVTIGVHRVRVVSADKHQDGEVQRVVVGVGRTTPIRVELAFRVGFVTLAGPDGSDAALDGAAIGKTPITRLPVKPGKHRLVIARPGFSDAVREIEVRAGLEEKVDAVLTAKAIPAPLPPKKVVKLETKPPVISTRTVSPRKTRVWAWVTTALTGAAFAAGAVLYFGAAKPSRDNMRDDYVNQAQDYNRRVTSGGVLLVGAGALGGLATALFFLHRDGAAAVDRKPAVSSIVNPR